MHPPERKYYEHYEKSPTSAQFIVQRTYCCLCCDYPTVSEPPSYEICQICNWEDDDCDPSGANGDYSLREARENFRRYLTMYRPHHEIAERFQKPGFRYVHDEDLRPERMAHKRRIIRELKEYMAETDLYRRGEIWKSIRWLSSCCIPTSDPMIKSFCKFSQTRSWHNLRDHLLNLPGVEIQAFADDPIVGSWIDFTLAGQFFTINAREGKFLFLFVEGMDRPASVMNIIASHCESLFGNGAAI